MSKEGQDKIYEMVTGRIMDSLKNGTVAWVKPWTAGNSIPVSMSTRKPYRGVNVWLLGLEALEKGYGSPFWGTFKHIQALGGMVRKGEKSTMIVFWKKLLVKDDNAPDGVKAIFMLRYYRVFNASQADGLPDRFFPKAVKRDAAETNADADKIIAGYLDNGPKLVKVAGDSANYRAPLDLVTLPLDEQFKSEALRYGATFHELSHSTGHKSRLNRPGIADFDHFGSGRYAMEELVADMSSAMLSATFGYDTIADNAADYIKGWLRALENDHKLVISASAKAQKASDMILGTKFDTEVSE
jgi:antirestriction protein ArdC